MGGVDEKLTPRGSSGSQKKTASKRNRVKAVSSACHPRDPGTSASTCSGPMACSIQAAEPRAQTQ